MAWAAELKRRNWYCICGTFMPEIFSRQLYEQLTKEERKKVQEYILFLISQRQKNEENNK